MIFCCKKVDKRGGKPVWKWLDFYHTFTTDFWQDLDGIRKDLPRQQKSEKPRKPL